MKPCRKTMYISGIYAIKNIINNKIYIGRSYNIYKRLVVHKSALNREFKKHENQYLINAWKKYGENNFECFVIEECIKNDKILSEKESLWINHYNSTDPKYGYNLRKDVVTYICHESTRKLLSQRLKERYDKPGTREQQSVRVKAFWKNNPDIKHNMSKKLSKLKTIYSILQFDKQMNFIKEFDSVQSVIFENPTYKWQNIYSVCNGYKPTYKSYIWKKKLKI